MLSRDSSSGEHAVEVSSSMLLDLLDITLLLIIGGDGGIIGSLDMDLVSSCTGGNCHSGANGKRSATVELEPFKWGEDIDGLVQGY